MQRFASILILGCSLAVSACGDDNSDTATTDNATTENATGNATTDANTSAVDSSGNATTDAATTDAMTTDAMTTDATTTDDPTGGAGACDPEADDDKCGLCVKDMCCDQLEACASDESGECQCFQTCVETQPGAAGVSACTKECAPEGSETITLLVNCSATMCAAPCL